ncbi:hypothetical protein N878_11270 [Pseudomonas sp. EGD-AK9]|nr:hypothetical protein N878_11270 [Pseudomonas sp. EGD-AK9]
MLWVRSDRSLMALRIGLISMVVGARGKSDGKAGDYTRASTAWQPVMGDQSALSGSTAQAFA